MSLTTDRADMLVQRGIWGSDHLTPTDRISEGSKAVDVLLEVVRLHPEISRLSYTQFEPQNPSNIDIDLPQSISWLARSLFTQNNLHKLSDLITTSTSTWIDLGEDNLGLKVFEAPAISSRVKLIGGSIAHIPVMDFEGLDIQSGDVLERIIETFNGQKGYILQTDNSYHFWGINLMSEKEWREFMQTCLVMEQSLNKDRKCLFDLNFLEKSLERGFGALRIFDYPPHKRVVPTVVKVIT